MWKLRCNGDTTTGLCVAVYRYYDSEAEETFDALLGKPELNTHVRIGIEQDGWTVTGPGDAPRLMCPAHVAAAAHMVAAELDGLPFNTTGYGE